MRIYISVRNRGNLLKGTVRLVGISPRDRHSYEAFEEERVLDLGTIDARLAGQASLPMGSQGAEVQLIVKGALSIDGATPTKPFSKFLDEIPAGGMP